VTGEDVCCDVDQSIKRFWEIETCGTDVDQPRIYTEEENAALTEVLKGIIKLQAVV
jgi:hypothetical protein